MIDPMEFARRFRSALIRIAAEARGVPEFEAYRKYQTDATFHAQVETIVLTAVSCIEDQEQVGDRLEPLRRAFTEEYSDMLGWKVADPS